MIHFVGGFSIFSACIIRTGSGSHRVFLDRINSKYTNPVATTLGSDKPRANEGNVERVRGKGKDQPLTLTRFPFPRLADLLGAALTTIERNERLESCKVLGESFVVIR